MDPSEVEFLGEKQLVSIIPNFTFNVIHLVSGPVGPFRAGLPVKVPLWVALNLKQQQKCKIIHQDWMNTEKLQSVLEEEKAHKFVYILWHIRQYNFSKKCCHSVFF